MANFVTWIVGAFPGAIELVERLSTQCTVAALSNTSPPHWEKVEATGLATPFDHLFLSHEIGHLKPHPAAFEAVTNTINCPANEVIFFDDNGENVQAAKDLGFIAHQVFNPVEASQVLSDYGL